MVDPTKSKRHELNICTALSSSIMHAAAHSRGSTEPKPPKLMQQHKIIPKEEGLSGPGRECGCFCRMCRLMVLTLSVASELPHTMQIIRRCSGLKSIR
ncbi:hypothetical protein JZ751_022705 [Albula glossodonta]|uniref:Uncharacterized protein n=1 Tax=Albula glossodonta TaxID=121402 RepID=A0A8T2PFZ1_9TELE|nr:hypothetical protein JZ751_022705 [Albula glossodonta]